MHKKTRKLPVLKESAVWENIENNGFLDLTSKMSAVRSRHRPPTQSKAFPQIVGDAFFYPCLLRLNKGLLWKVESFSSGFSASTYVLAINSDINSVRDFAK